MLLCITIWSLFITLSILLLFPLEANLILQYVMSCLLQLRQGDDGASLAAEVI
jgi:hypothetical protein